MKNQGTIFAVIVALLSMVVVVGASHSSIKTQGEDYKVKYELAIDRINARTMEVNNLTANVESLTNQLETVNDNVTNLTSQVKTNEYKIKAQDIVINNQSNDLESFKVFTRAILVSNYSE